MTSDILALPFILVVIYWFIGISGNWKKTLLLIIFNGIALIMAFQHSRSLAITDTFISLIDPVNNAQGTAISFLICFFVAMVGISVLYRVLWHFEGEQSIQSTGGLFRFIQSILTGVAGWGIGVMITIGYIMTNVNPYIQNSLTQSDLFPVYKATATVLSSISMPLAINGIPEFLLQWLVK